MSHPRRVSRLAQLGISLEAFTELTFSGDTRVDVIASVGHGIPEVQRVFTMAGDPDALAWLRVRDVADPQRVVDLLRAAGHVTGTETMIGVAVVGEHLVF